MLLFFAIIVTAVALMPAGAHFLELPNKIGMPQDRYLTVQQIYAGWQFLGVVLLAEIVLDVMLVLSLRGEPGMVGAIVALLGALASLAVFFVWTFPANRATDNWTTAPGDFAALRVQWEYSHAAAAVATFIALCALTWVATRA